MKRNNTNYKNILFHVSVFQRRARTGPRDSGKIKAPPQLNCSPDIHVFTLPVSLVSKNLNFEAL
jgi:hypothetical protein